VWGYLHRQSDYKLTTPPWSLTVSLDTATVHVNYTLRQRKPDSEPPFSAVKRALGLNERFKDARQ
jgi:hypothetical protein